MTKHEKEDEIISPSTLIEYADQQIDQMVNYEKHRQNSNRTSQLNKQWNHNIVKNLSQHEKNYLILKFLKMKNKPLENRKFYDQFYKQQDKAERILSLKSVEKDIKELLEQEKEENQK